MNFEEANVIGEVAAPAFVLDTGATENAVGVKTLDEILKRTRLRHKVVTDDKPSFRFGDGLTLTARSRVDLMETALGDISFYVLDGDHRPQTHQAEMTPALVGSKFLIENKATISYSEMMLLLRAPGGELWAAGLEKGKSGHLRVPVDHHMVNLSALRGQLEEKYEITLPGDAKRLLDIVATPGAVQELQECQGEIVGFRHEGWRSRRKKKTGCAPGECQVVPVPGSDVERCVHCGWIEEGSADVGNSGACQEQHVHSVVLGDGHASILALDGADHCESSAAAQAQRLCSLRFRLANLRARNFLLDPSPNGLEGGAPLRRSSSPRLAMWRAAPARCDPEQPVRDLDVLRSVWPASPVPLQGTGPGTHEDCGTVAGDRPGGARRADGDNERGRHDGDGREGEDLGDLRQDDAERHSPGDEHRDGGTCHEGQRQGQDQRTREDGARADLRESPCRGQEPSGAICSQEPSRPQEECGAPDRVHGAGGGLHPPAEPGDGIESGGSARGTPQGGGPGRRDHGLGRHLPGRAGRADVHFPRLSARLRALKEKVFGRTEHEELAEKESQDSHAVRVEDYVEDFVPGDPAEGEDQKDLPVQGLAVRAKGVTCRHRRQMKAASANYFSTLLCTTTALFGLFEYRPNVFEVNLNSDEHLGLGPEKGLTYEVRSYKRGYDIEKTPVIKFVMNEIEEKKPDFLWLAMPMRPNRNWKASLPKAAENLRRNERRDVQRARTWISAAVQQMEEGRHFAVVWSEGAYWWKCQAAQELTDRAAMMGIKIFDVGVHGCSYHVGKEAVPAWSSWRIWTSSSQVATTLRRRRCPGHGEHEEDWNPAFPAGLKADLAMAWTPSTS